MPASERRTLPSAIGIIATGVAVSAGIWLLYFMAVTLMMPHPIEYREGAAQVVTQLLLAGKNPFTPENQPLGMTNYGILFSLVVWPLAALFGNTLLVHRFVTVLFIVLSAYVLARTAISANQQIAVSIVGAELAAAALATRGGLGGYPSSMGAFFFLAAITVPYIRRFDRWGLVLSAAASLLALFAKPYFILGVGTVACYTFLFVSKRTGLLYALGFAAATGLAVLLVRRILPLYFYDTIFSNLSQAEQNTPAHLVRQLHQLAVEFPPLIVAGMLLMLAAVVSWKQGPGGRSGDFSVRSLLALDRGVFAHPLDYFGFTAVCTLLTFILILGPHPGNYMNYAYQLVVPVSILWLLVSLRPERSIALVVIALLIANLILFVLTRLPRGDLVQTPDSRSAWKALYGYAEACQRPLNTPPVVPVMINRGLWPQDSGHTEYFFGSRPIPGMRWFGARHEVVSEVGTRYLRALRASVAHQEFDCVMLARHSGWPRRELPLKRGNYKLKDSMVIAMPESGQTWQIDIWVPGED